MFRCLHDYVRFFTLRLDFFRFRVCLKKKILQDMIQCYMQMTYIA